MGLKIKSIIASLVYLSFSILSGVAAPGDGHWGGNGGDWAEHSGDLYADRGWDTNYYHGNYYKNNYRGYGGYYYKPGLIRYGYPTYSGYYDYPSSYSTYVYPSYPYNGYYYHGNDKRYGYPRYGQPSTGVYIYSN